MRGGFLLSAVVVALDETFGFVGPPSDVILLRSRNQVVHRLSFSRSALRRSRLGSTTVVSRWWFSSSWPILLLFPKLSVEVGEIFASRLFQRPNNLVWFLGSNPFVRFVAVGLLCW